jgi:hypothetical protein
MLNDDGCLTGDVDDDDGGLSAEVNADVVVDKGLGVDEDHLQ